MNNNQGKNLIFLISQPRSGSTLTQRIIGAHSQIHTQSEPWIMLHPLNALKSNNIHAAYDMDLYIKGAMDFISHLPGKERHYKNILSDAYQNLYDSILEQEKKSFFLDKTPRYYYIIEELASYFPKSKFIFLWRNPAAVLTSIVQTWSKADWYRLSEWKDDLLVAPRLMLNGITDLQDRAFVLRYEDLLMNPNALVKQVCKFLAVPFEEKIIEYGKFTVPKWQYGDQLTINQKMRPDISRANAWPTHLKNPQMWRIIYDYLNYLGSDLVSSMGYTFDDIDSLLEQNKPSTDINIHTLPLIDFLNTNRSILVENKRLQKELKNANDGLKSRDENLKMRNEAIAQKDRLLREKEKIFQQFEIEASNIQESLEEKKRLVDKQQTIIKQREKQIEKNATELGSLAEALSEKDQVLQKRNNEISSFKQSLQEKESIIKQLISEIGSLKHSLQEKESKVEHLDSVVASLKRSLSDKEALVTTLDSEITAQKNELGLTKSAARKLQNQLAALQDKLQNTEESNQHLKETMLNQHKQINELKELIKGIERSYTFRIGTFIIWPARKLKNLMD